MSTTSTSDRSALIAEAKEVSRRLIHDRELVVMCQSQLVEVPKLSIGSKRRPLELKARLEALPDFEEQMRTSPEFREAYEGLIAATDL